MSYGCSAERQFIVYVAVSTQFESFIWMQHIVAVGRIECFETHISYVCWLCRLTGKVFGRPMKLKVTSELHVYQALYIVVQQGRD